VNCQFSIVNSSRYQQPEATRIINLQQSEGEILNQMKPKGRYNIRIAEKHGVIVEESDDIDAFYELIKETTKRDRFKGHSKKHYQKFLTELEDSFLLLAHLPQNKKPIAGLLGVIWGETGLYYYGASNASHRAVMAPYALQWKSMRLSKTKGCSSYDLFGITPPTIQSLNKAPLSQWERGWGRGYKKNHPWKGVSAFKEKFGGEVVMYPEEKVVVLQPFVHSLLKVKRKLLP
ncbi:peptidoglycan bridge formation glycyltransferase FemA/FemB family protein, partial [Patescibacteria group bacterium]|nr:peptidoglycan bridge formation glycyltransferase FemA/FemB family protein [Patescibacteria group bacterium]